MSFVDSLKKGLFGSEDDYDDQYMDDGPQMVNNNNGLGVAGNEEEARYRFYDDKLDASDSAGSVETPYSQVTDLVETERYFLVFLKSGQCVLARKTDFTVGEAADFKDFLTRACGRDMRFFEMPKRNGR